MQLWKSQNSEDGTLIAGGSMVKIEILQLRHGSLCEVWGHFSHFDFRCCDSVIYSEFTPLNDDLLGDWVRSLVHRRFRVCHSVVDNTSH
jgi:hypothetical protein